MKTNHYLLLRLLCVILGVTWVLVMNMNMRHLAEYSGSSSGTSVHTSAVTCTEKLDKLDQFFDQRREARSKALTENINHENWDWYEPESVCLSEERFGSDQRHVAFGDGTF